MAGQGRLPHHILPAAGPIMGGGLRAVPGVIGSGIAPIFDGVQPQLLSGEKITTQHAEIQRLLSENQRLAATHVVLRQEFAAAQQEVQRLQHFLGRARAEKDQQFQALTERATKMEAELRALEPVRVELQRAQSEVQKLLGGRQELSAQLQQLTQEMHRSRSDVQLVPSLKMEIDGLSQEIQRARMAFDFEQKANSELLEQRTAMEKNLVSMAREVEKLRAELTNLEKQARVSAGMYGGAPGLEAGYSSVPSYGEGYRMGQIGAVADNGVPFGAGAPSAWGGYDMQRAGVRR